MSFPSNIHERNRLLTKTRDSSLIANKPTQNFLDYESCVKSFFASRELKCQRPSHIG